MSFVRIVVLDYTHVATKKECTGSEIYAGKFDRIEQCFQKCKRISSIFAWGTNEFGTIRCDENDEMGPCKCLCETAAKPGGSCTQTSHNGYRIYRLTPGVFPNFNLRMNRKKHYHIDEM